VTKRNEGETTTCSGLVSQPDTHFWGTQGCKTRGDRPTLKLCHALCHNPAIPTEVCLCRRVSLYDKLEAATMLQISMNTASRYHSVSFAIFNASLR
jgi:hypothetical protein